MPPAGSENKPRNGPEREVVIFTKNAIVNAKAYEPIASGRDFKNISLAEILSKIGFSRSKTSEMFCAEN